MSSFLCYTAPMYWKEYGRPSPYRMNKKKKPAKTAGKILYRYPNDNAPYGYERLELSEEWWKILVEEDHKEYSNNRRHDEKRSDIWEDYFDDEDSITSDDGGGLYYSNKKLIAYEKRIWEDLENFLCESWDKCTLVHSFSDEDFAIYLLTVEKGINQKRAAELLGISTARICRRLKIILHKILTEKMNTGTYSPKRLEAEAEYRRFAITGKTDSFIDVYVFAFLTQLNRDMVMRYLYCLFGTYQLFHYCFIFLYRFDTSEKLTKLKPERLTKFLHPYSRRLYERYARKLSEPFKLLFIFLELKCAENLKRVGLYTKPANKAFLEKVRKTANRCHISVEELKNKRIFPFMQKEMEKRVDQFQKALKAKSKPIKK